MLCVFIVFWVPLLTLIEYVFFLGTCFLDLFWFPFCVIYIFDVFCWPDFCWNSSFHRGMLFERWSAQSHLFVSAVARALFSLSAPNASNVATSRRTQTHLITHIFEKHMHTCEKMCKLMCPYSSVCVCMHLGTFLRICTHTSAYICLPLHTSVYLCPYLCIPLCTPA